jgi:hypothetical protein
MINCQYARRHCRLTLHPHTVCGRLTHNRLELRCGGTLLMQVTQCKQLVRLAMLAASDTLKSDAKLAKLVGRLAVGGVGRGRCKLPLFSTDVDGQVGTRAEDSRQLLSAVARCCSCARCAHMRSCN